MASGLSVSDVVNVSVDLSPKAAAYRGFGNMIIVGPSDVISTDERRRAYSGLDGIAQDFGTNSPEYLAADLFFSQVPQPDFCWVGRWAQTDTHGRLIGGVMSPTQQILTNFTVVTAGSFHVSIDGSAHDVTTIDLSGCLNLNGVASAIQTAIRAIGSGGFSQATVKWDSIQHQFTIRSGTAGTASSVGFMTAAGSGTFLGALLNMTSTTAVAPVVGIAAETLLSCASTLADRFVDWYGMAVASSTPPDDADLIATAQFVEGTSLSRIMAVTLQEPNTLDGTTSADVGSSLQTLNLNRTFSQYSTSSPYAAVSILGRIATIDFEGSNTTLTVKFKQEPGVAAETLTETQARVLLSKNVNAFVNYINNTAIIQEGVMASGMFIDERHGADWLQNALQTDVYNALYTSTTKIPQTDDGIHILVTVCAHTMDRAVNNGLVAPGVWTGPPIGQLKTGDTLPNGYYIYVPRVATQSDADRAARKAPPIQIAAKLAGAVHSANVLVTLNR
jgi:hypothetical protein